MKNFTLLTILVSTIVLASSFSQARLVSRSVRNVNVDCTPTPTQFFTYNVGKIPLPQVQNNKDYFFIPKAFGPIEDAINEVIGNKPKSSYGLPSPAPKPAYQSPHGPHGGQEGPTPPGSNSGPNPAPASTGSSPSTSSPGPAPTTPSSPTPTPPTSSDTPAPSPSAAAEASPTVSSSPTIPSPSPDTAAATPDTGSKQGTPSSDLIPQLNAPTTPSVQWTPERANTWYAAQGFIKGVNYVNAGSVNELEMLQGETYNPTQIDAELQLLQSIGFNTVRIFLHNGAYDVDKEGFFNRVDGILGICFRYNIKAMLVLFDSVWNPDYSTGPQPAPRPGIHNSQWVQSPGRAILQDQSTWSRLEAYTTETVARFASDERVLLWDVWNEPNNINGGSYNATELSNKEQILEGLLPQVFTWVRNAGPTQPLTSGIWDGADWSSEATLSPLQRTQVLQSDVTSFHDYSPQDVFTGRLNSLRWLNRPILCTEYMARNFNSTFQAILPIGQQNNVGMISWGHVVGKTQTNIPWDSYQNPTKYLPGSTFLWQHEIFNADFSPYIQAEVDFLRSI